MSGKVGAVRVRLAVLTVVLAVAACVSGPVTPTEAPAASNLATVPAATPAIATSSAGATTSGPGTASPGTPSPTPSARPRSRVEGRGETPVLVGRPISAALLTGRIVFDDFEDIYTMNTDGSDLRTVAGRDGAEFDGVWSPDGRFIAYRDSRRGINEDDEIYVVAADGSGARNLTNDPANDWGPDWSPDGEWIVFNSDRDGIPLRGYLMRPDGTDVRRIEAKGWVEYPSFSPDGRRIAYEGAVGSDYEVYVADLATGSSVRLTDSRGGDGWPAWSPDGRTIAFSTERDDCERAPADQDCWRTGEPGEHRDIWLMEPDGSNQRRVTPEFGHFVTWSPDGSLLLVSGHTLYAIRPDGTGRRELRAEGLAYPPGGIPDWTP